MSDAPLSLPTAPAGNTETTLSQDYHGIDWLNKPNGRISPADLVALLLRTSSLSVDGKSFTGEVYTSQTDYPSLTSIIAALRVVVAEAEALLQDYDTLQTKTSGLSSDGGTYTGKVADAISGSAGVNTDNGDLPGAGLHYAKSYSAPWFIYTNADGSTSGFPIATQKDALSGSYGIADGSGDLEGVGLHYAAKYQEAWFSYRNADGTTGGFGLPTSSQVNAKMSKGSGNAPQDLTGTSSTADVAAFCNALKSALAAAGLWG